MKPRGPSKERAEFWRGHHERHQASKLPVDAYCKQEGIGKQSFYQWRNRLRSGKQAAQPEIAVRFAEMKASTKSLSSTPSCDSIASIIKIRLADGHEVELSPGADTATIHQILQTLLQVQTRVEPSNAKSRRA